MIFINNQSDFNKICEDLSHEKIIYMDTEFHRRRTYHAILSIIQISSPNHKIIIDALVAELNLSALKVIGFSTLVKQGDGTLLYEIPFLDRMAIVFIISVLGMYIISMIENIKGTRVNGLEVDTKMFRTTNGFAVGALIVFGIIAALYTLFW